MSDSIVSYGLKKWQDIRVLWLCIVIGISLFVSFLTIGLQVLPAIQSPIPTWVKDKGSHYLTIGRKNSAGEFVPISGSQLKPLYTAASIDSVATIGFRTTNFKLPTLQEKKLEVAYVDPNFIKLSTLSSSIGDYDQFGNMAYVSEDIWLKLNKLPAASRRITHSNSNISYLVIGEIPKGLWKVGKNYPDILLAQSQLIYTLPFRIAADKSPEYKAKFTTILEGFPVYYALIKSTSPVDSSRVHLILNDYKNSNFKEIKKEIWITEHVEFSPKLRNAINQQCLFVLSLIIILGFISYFNLFGATTNQLLNRHEEFKIRMVVGATKRNLIKLCCIEQLPMLFTITLTSFLIYFSLVESLAQQATYQQYFPYRISANSVLWLTILFFNLIVIILCTVAPLLGVRTNQLFNRMSAKFGNRSISNIQNIIAVIQISFTILIITITINMYLEAMKHRQEFSFPSNISEYSISLNKPTSVNFIHQLLTNDELKKSAAWADQPFIGNSQLIATARLINGSEITSRIKFISNDYFSTIGASVQYHELENVFKGAVLNASALRQLNTQVNNQQLQISTLLKSYSLPIIGRVQDLPHIGNKYTNQPVIYIFFKQDPDISLKNIFVYHEEQSDFLFKEYLINLLDDSIEGVKVLKHEKVQSQLEKRNHIQITLLNLSTLITAIVLCLLSASFYIQNNKNIIHNKLRFGIMRAVGAPHSIFYKILAKKNNQLLVVSSVLSLIIVLATKSEIEKMLESSVSILLPFSIATITACFIINISTLISTFRLKYDSIKAMLEN